MPKTAALLAEESVSFWKAERCVKTDDKKTLGIGFVTPNRKKTAPLFVSYWI